MLLYATTGCLVLLADSVEMSVFGGKCTCIPPLVVPIEKKSNANKVNIA